MAKRYLDFNKPIMDNRPEKIFIKFNGCIKNACEVMLVSMIENDFGYWLARYPGIEKYAAMEDLKEAYYNLMYFTPRRFLVEMRKPLKELTENEIVQDESRLMGDLAIPDYASITSLEIGIREICKYDFCKSITVYDTAMSDKTKMYIANLFAGYEDKIFLYQGFLSEIIDKKPDATTIFIDDVEDLMKIMEECEFNKTMDKFKEKQLFVEGMNAIIDTKEDGSPVFKFNDYMMEANDRFDANVAWIVSHYIDLNDPNPMVDMNDHVKPKNDEDNANSINN